MRENNSNLNDIVIILSVLTQSKLINKIIFFCL